MPLSIQNNMSYQLFFYIYKPFCSASKFSYALVRLWKLCFTTPPAFLFLTALEKSKSGTNSSLQTILKDNINKLIFEHLNINSVQNKFDCLADVIKNNIDFLMISEIEVDNPFPHGQFFQDHFGTPFRLDQNRNVGSIMFFIRNDILANVFSTDDRSIQSFLCRVKFLKKKWLLYCSCNFKHSSTESHLDSLS